MADNVSLPATGSTVGTDEVSIGGVIQHVQRVKLVDGTDGGTDLLPGSAARGLRVDPRPSLVRKTITPTISTTAYTPGDALGSAVLEVTNAVRTAGGSGRIDSVVVVDKDAEAAALDLVLFSAAPTAPTDNVAFDPTDAELADCLGQIPISPGSYGIFSDNAIASVPNLGLSFVVPATSLYVVPVIRSTKTFTSTSDLSFILTILQD